MKLTIDEVLRQARPVLPVLVIDDVALGLELARALRDGGIRVLEVTLRTAQGLDALAAICRELPELLVGAGTLLHAAQFQEVRDAGARFAVSPGFNERLVEAAQAADLPYLPGVMTPSDVMRALECGFRELKLFPADVAGGVKMLKSLSGPFPGLRFCPTGGVTPANLQEFLALPNVACVGGSWVAPADLLKARDWAQISRLAEQARALAGMADAQP